MVHFFRIKIFTFISLFIILYTTSSLSRNTEYVFSEKNISNYFSGIISINQNNTSQAFDFLKKTQPLQTYHYNYNVQFLRTLVLLKKFDESFDFAKSLDLKNGDFYELNLLLGIDYFINNDYLNAEKHFNLLSNGHATDYQIESYVGDFLSVMVVASQNNKNESLKRLDSISDRLINLKKIQEVFLHCYFESPATISMFKSLVNDEAETFSRYNFFLVNYLLHKNNISDAKKVIDKSYEDYNHNVLIHQSYEFIIKQNYTKIKNFFNCKNPKDLLSEFFYVIANFYSNEENYTLSNFYLNISIYLNKNFSTNQSLLAENYFNQDKEKSAQKIYSSIKKIGNIYSWYASKRLAYIIASTGKKQKAIKYLKKEISKITEPSYYNYLDLANFLNNNKNYKEAIRYYSITLKKLESNHSLIPTILEKRGTSYERLGIWDKAEKDLKKSLKLSPDQPYVLNYLAYSWLEKKKNIAESLQMLIRADELKQNDGYITDSLGWGFYLTKDYLKAEKLLRRAVILMPTDPVIADHYGDILWKLNKNIQARYFWKQAQKLELEDKEFIENINEKLIFGLMDKS